MIFSSENVGLHIYTNNVDSIKYYSEENIPNPFGPSMITYSAKINTVESARVHIKIKYQVGSCLFTFIWNRILPVAYRFDWLQYTYALPSGIYYLEKIVNDISKTYKVMLVK